jgi:hypothetical protein
MTEKGKIMSEATSAAPVAAESASIEQSAESSAPIAQSAEAVPANPAELQEQVQEALDKGDKKAANKLIKEFEIKVNGKSKKVAIDWNNEQDIIRRLQLAEASQPAMQRAAELEKFLQAHAMELKNNPRKVLEELGMNPDELAEAWITSKLQEMEKSPEAKEREKMMAELESLRKEKEDLAKKSQEEAQTRLMEQAHAELENEILEELQNNKKLPKSQKTVRRIYDAMLWAMDNGIDDVKVKDVVPAVEREIKAEFDEFLTNAPEDVLEYYVNQKIVDKMRKKRVASAVKAKEMPQTANVKEIIKPSAQEDKEEKRIKSKDFFSSLRGY